jgi:hypothetical protein
MKIEARTVFIAGALVLGACSGNFATGTGMPQQGGIPPVNASGMPPYSQNGIPQNGSPSPSASVSPGVANAGTYALTDAQTGFGCPPTIDGYGCTLRFNLPPATPTPAPLKKGARKQPTPTPSPTPSPTPTPDPNASASPSVKPTPTPHIATIALKDEALPKDAPAMVHTPANSLDVIPLMMVRLTPSDDFALDGRAQAEFTLPKSQLEERGFAVQLFKANIGKRKTTYVPVWTFDKSTLTGSTLTFDFNPPKTQIAKGNTYVLVLYGDDKSKEPTPSPGPSSSTAPAPSPSSSATP